MIRKIANCSAISMAAGLALLMMSACASNQTVSRSGGTPRPMQTAPTPTLPAVPIAVQSPDDSDGSLWNDRGPFGDLFVLPKARRVGDIVTVKIVESSSATNQANTVTERDSSLSASIDAFLGLEQKYLNTAHPDYDAGRNFNPFGAIRGGMASEFDGSGATSRSGDLTAFMTARVTEVLPGGNLRIEGSREVEVNNEKQLISLSGFVRVRDIAPDNVVLSTFISDARIAYSGEGDIDDRQRPGWMANFLNKIWPF
jgi:flagellar L-ring protein precursor FlgH